MVGDRPFHRNLSISESFPFKLRNYRWGRADSAPRPHDYQTGRDHMNSDLVPHQHGDRRHFFMRKTTTVRAGAIVLFSTTVAGLVSERMTSLVDRADVL